jgi:type VI secretion system protein ImpK
MARFRMKISRPGGEAPARPRGHLALSLQEALIATVRLRDNRQSATNAETFRVRIKQSLAEAEQEGRKAGYSGDDVRSAIYAVVVFLDESVLNSSLVMFSEWPRRPLQEELFGGHTGGEIFFQNLHQLLTRPETEQLADVLEVYQLCLLLGFQGRYSRMDLGELRGLTLVVSDKVQRIRGRLGDLSPAWSPPSGETIAPARDPWVRRLAFIAGTTFVIAWLLFAAFRFALFSDTTHILGVAR